MRKSNFLSDRREKYPFLEGGLIKGKILKSPERGTAYNERLGFPKI